MNKLKTIIYIFLLTVVPQTISLVSFGIVLSVCLTWGTYKSFWLMILGLVSIITYEFLLIGLSVFIKSYGMSIFSAIRTDYAQYSPSQPMKKTNYYVYKNQGLLGDGYSVYKREITQSGCLLSLGLLAIINSVTGIFKFFLETLRVLFDKQRQDAWEYCKKYFYEKKGKDSLYVFMKMPIICCCIFLIVTSCYVPVKLIMDSNHDVDDLQITITEKYNSESNKFRVHTIFYGEIKNRGKGKVSSVAGTVYYKNRQEKILYSCNQTILASFEMRHDPLLEEDETWNFSFEVQAQPTDLEAQELWNSSLDEIEVWFDITEVWYDKKVCIKNPDKKSYIIHKIK